MTVSFNPIDDMAIMDGLETVTVQSHDGTFTDTADNSIHRRISNSEAEASNGRFIRDDVVFHVPKQELNFTPYAGCRLTDASGIVWSILSAHVETIGTRWRLACRHHDILNEAATLVTIQRATWSKSEGGAQQQTWGTLASNQRCWIQRLSARVGSEDGQRESKASYRAHFESQTIVGAGNRIVSSDGTKYRVVGDSNSDRIDQLYSVDLELWD